MHNNRKLILRLLSSALIIAFLGQEISYAAPLSTGAPSLVPATSLEAVIQDPARFEVVQENEV